MTDIHTHIPTLDLACTNTHTSRGLSYFSTSRSVPLQTHKLLSTGHLVDDDRHAYMHPYLYPFAWLLAQTHLSLVSLAHIQDYTQLAYLCHQCRASLLSRDSHIADRAGRHPGAERPFSSFRSVSIIYLHYCIQNSITGLLLRETAK